MIWPEDESLDCQDCGKALHVLTQAEVQIVAQRPYDFIMYCYLCKELRRENGFY